MCPIKHLLAKRSERNLRNPALSPYPPNVFPFKRESEGETNHELSWDFSPKRESRREPNHGSKFKRESAVVRQPRLLPFPLFFFLFLQLTLVVPQPERCYDIYQEVYTARELFVGRPKIYWISDLVWRELEQTWWYQLKEGERPDGHVVGWVAEAAIKAAKSDGKGLC